MTVFVEAMNEADAPAEVAIKSDLPYANFEEADTHCGVRGGAVIALTGKELEEFDAVEGCFGVTVVLVELVVVLVLVLVVVVVAVAWVNTGDGGPLPAMLVATTENE